MMALPHAQYVITEASQPVSGVNNNQVKTVSDADSCWEESNKYKSGFCTSEAVTFFSLHSGNQILGINRAELFLHKCCLNILVIK